MLAYTIRRFILIIPTLLLVTMLVYMSIRFIPGDVVQMMVSQMSQSGAVSNLTVESLRAQMGLNVPIGLQYIRWLGVWPQANGHFAGLIEGNLGESLWKNQPVTTLIAERIPVTGELAIIAVVTAIIVALPVGIYSAIRQDTFGDYAGRTFSIVFISVPAFWVGTMVMVYPAIWWGWAPALRYIPLSKDVGGNLLQFIIPGFIMGMVMSGTLMRITRTMMLEVLRQDYIRTAWAKGLTERVIILRHALKNALLPVITIIGIMIPMVIAGSIVMEQIFVLPGVGLLTFDALNQRDYPLISGINVFIAVVVLISNLLVDLAYAWLDPRIKYG